MHPIEALTCLLETLNRKSFGKTLSSLQDVRKSKSRIVILCLKSNFPTTLTYVTKL